MVERFAVKGELCSGVRLFFLAGLAMAGPYCWCRFAGK